ncbi:hypothetical protein GCM10009549_19490 [Streptomyces thermoalcalitolerans]|uniref:Uncharacterized protein n=1 Tax=Streptomyces thermoalcalitolerans TaxID=65605 RepID=A0ABN1NJC2_9ACTN
MGEPDGAGEHAGTAVMVAAVVMAPMNRRLLHRSPGSRLFPDTRLSPGEENFRRGTPAPLIMPALYGFFRRDVHEFFSGNVHEERRIAPSS